jgi:hypothetical protein
MSIEIKNAVIERVSIDTERCLSAWLHLSYGGSGQGFGGFALYMPPWNDKGHNERSRYIGNYTGVFIHRCIEIGGVMTWEELPGKTIRVKSEHTKIHAIGHIVKDDWFDPAAEFERIRALISRDEANAA